MGAICAGCFRFHVTTDDNQILYRSPEVRCSRNGVILRYGFLQNGKHPWYSDRKQTTIWNYDKPKRNKDHPTSKPLDLLGYPIQNSSQENSVVIDTFGGSGSTLMACEQLNRVCYMMELDPKYASVILRRYVEDTGDEENVYVIRNGEKLLYSALAKKVETSPTAGV